MDSISKYDINGLLFEMPLYESLNIDITEIQKINGKTIRYTGFQEYEEDVYEEMYPNDFNKLINFLINQDNIYGYCNECKRQNSLKCVKVNLNEQLLERRLNGQCGDDYENYDDELALIVLKDRINSLLKSHRYFTKYVVCSHDSSHTQIFLYKLKIQELENGEKKLVLQKIGQDPSNVEFFNYNIRERYSKYKNYKNISSDLSKAIISYENNFAVGGFLYLRRVLEKVVDYTYEECKSTLSNENQAKYEDKNIKFKGKIDILKDKLPEHLTENGYIYKILSAGVHSLTEEECLEFFHVVKESVYFMLDELLEIQNREMQNKKIGSELNKINSKISSMIKES